MLEFSHPHFDSSTYIFLLFKSTFDKKNCKPFIHYFDRKRIESSFSLWQYKIKSHSIGKTEARHLNLEIVIRPKCERQSIVDIDISQMCQRVKNQFRTPFVSVFWEKANISSSICDLAEIAVSRFFSFSENAHHMGSLRSSYDTLCRLLTPHSSSLPINLSNSPRVSYFPWKHSVQLRRRILPRDLFSRKWHAIFLQSWILY